MEYYKKDKSVIHTVQNPFLEILKTETKICDVNVSEFSHINKVLGYALRKSSHKDTDMLMLIGQGRAIPKTEKIANIMMTKVNNLHRCDASTQRQHEDIWIARDLDSLLDDLSVIRNVPVRFILLAKENLPEEIRAHPNRLQIYGAKSTNSSSTANKKKSFIHKSDSNNNSRTRKVSKQPRNK